MSPVRPIVYVNPTGSLHEIPLARFLPTDPPRMVVGWLERQATRGDLLLDPLGASPTMAIEVALAGYRMIVACNNPVTAFELRMLASQPSQAELTAVLVDLASQKKGEERLENAIKELYQTTCASCGERIQASGYLWHRGETIPHARIYHCPNCQDSGEHPITDEDAVIVQQMQRSEKLHRSRALERVIGSSSDDRQMVEEALEVYNSRPLYVLFTLLNKLEGMNLSTRKRELLESLLLSLMDAGNTLWAWPQERERPRQLSTPPIYLEKNLWLELESAITTWTSLSQQVEVTTWPTLPRGAGICIYPGRVRDLAQTKPMIEVGKIVTVIPRPAQAFWTLCSLWASWLWGREKAGKFVQVMDRKRFDWHWHTIALHSALSSTVVLAGENVPVFGVIPEPVPGLINAVVEATAVSGMNLSGFATKNALDPVQIEWKTGTTNREFTPVNAQKIARDAIRELLNEIGEPTDYLELHTAAMCTLADGKAFPPSIQHLTHEKAAEIQSMLNKLLADRQFLRRMESTAQDPESGLWWLAQPESTQTPLADRVELEILEVLQRDKKIHISELYKNIYQRFPGYLTPPDSLIHECLSSYAHFDLANQTWTFKQNEDAAIRIQDAQEIQDLITLIERKLKLKTQGEHPITWYRDSKSSTPLYQLVLTTTGVIDRELLENVPDQCQVVFIFPGSRSGLLQFKIKRDPNLAELLTENCHFLKFRTLRSIANRGDLSLELWKVLIESDPVSLEETTQLSMFR